MGFMVLVAAGWMYFRHLENGKLKNKLAAKEYVSITGERIPIGIYDNLPEKDGSDSVSVYGLVSDYYKTDNNFVLVMETLAGDRPVKFRINMGPEDFILQEHTFIRSGTVPAEVAALGRSDLAFDYIDSYEFTTTGNLWQKYQQRKGEVVRIDLFTRMAAIADCDDMCRLRQDQFSTLGSNNRQLEKFEPDSSIADALLGRTKAYEFGMPILVSYTYSK